MVLVKNIYKFILTINLFLFYLVHSLICFNSEGSFLSKFLDWLPVNTNQIQKVGNITWDQDVQLV